MEVPKVIKVSILIKDKYLNDLRQFVQTNEEASRVVSKNTDFVYFCSPISGMAIAPNSLSSGLNRAVKHFLQHQSC